MHNNPEQEMTEAENSNDQSAQAATTSVKTEDWQRQAEEYLAGWQRAKADYVNLKKETDKRQSELAHFANMSLVMDLLPVINHYNLAWKHVPAEHRTAEWMKGFGYVKQQFDEVLKQLGISMIQTVGQVFDPKFHEAVAAEKKSDQKTDTIFEEVQAGYLWHDQVIQPAKVKVVA